MVYTYATVLTLVNLACWVSILFGLPGTWLMLLVTALLKWWQPAHVLVSWTVLGVVVGLAVLGEVLEFVLGAAGARHAGGSTRAAGLALGPRELLQVRPNRTLQGADETREFLSARGWRDDAHKGGWTSAVASWAGYWARRCRCRWSAP